MKKIIALVLCTVFALGLFGCAFTEESESSYTLSALEKAEEVTVHLYKDGGTTLSLEVTDELLSLTEGTWEKRSGMGDGEKVLTLTVGTQHEITFFDNGVAMIYYGYANIIEKDRCYYNVTLDGELGSLYNYCLEKGTVPETEE